MSDQTGNSTLSFLHWSFDGWLALFLLGCAWGVFFYVLTEWRPAKVKFNRAARLIYDELRLNFSTINSTVVSQNKDHYRFISVRFFDHLGYEVISRFKNKEAGDALITLYRGFELLRDVPTTDINSWLEVINSAFVKFSQNAKPVYKQCDLDVLQEQWKALALILRSRKYLDLRR